MILSNKVAVPKQVSNPQKLKSADYKFLKITTLGQSGKEFTQS